MEWEEVNSNQCNKETDNFNHNNSSLSTLDRSKYNSHKMISICSQWKISSFNHHNNNNHNSNSSNHNSHFNSHNNHKPHFNNQGNKDLLTKIIINLTLILIIYRNLTSVANKINLNKTMTILWMKSMLYSPNKIKINSKGWTNNQCTPQINYILPKLNHTFLNNQDNQETREHSHHHADWITAEMFVIISIKFFKYFIKIILVINYF